MGLRPPEMSSWRKDRHTVAIREFMIERITDVSIRNDQDKNLRASEIIQIPLLSKFFEKYLFLHARSKEEYLNPSTLDSRLRTARRVFLNFRRALRHCDSSPFPVADTGTKGNQLGPTDIYGDFPREIVDSLNGVTGYSQLSTHMLPQPASGCGSINTFTESKCHADAWHKFLRCYIHSSSCFAPKGKCPINFCRRMKEIIVHSNMCYNPHCRSFRCLEYRKLIAHYQKCSDSNCIICGPVRISEETRRESSGEVQMCLEVQMPIEVKMGSAECPLKEGLTNYVELKNDMSDEAKTSQDNAIGNKEKMDMNIEPDVTWKEEIATNCAEVIKSPNEFSVPAKHEDVCVHFEVDHVEPETKRIVAEQLSDGVEGESSVKSEVKGVAMTELFTVEQIKAHIRSLRQWIDEGNAKAMGQLLNENNCKLCFMETLTFAPPAIYCDLCYAQIKQNALYHTSLGENLLRKNAKRSHYYFCKQCYTKLPRENFEVDGAVIEKQTLEEKKNDETPHESWVQCDKCEGWQHEICALFNSKRNKGRAAEYTCPICHVKEIESGDRKPVSGSYFLGAKDLTKTLLSDHIEQRVFRSLEKERKQRARALGKNFDEVPAVENLVIRVISSVDKRVEVKQKFGDIFQNKSYPLEFPYKSKAILLFQKIEGVDVMLFIMFVQECGSECESPNHRRVYISYIDSVKYFCPDIKAVNGEALRTFVYHEILIGYLDFIKKRGFTSCYIWASPPSKGGDYIFYCHPEIQKTPKPDKLREWYRSMLQKATMEDIVVDHCNLYNHFFISTRDNKAKVTAARLPYFDGDYLPGEIENIISCIQDTKITNRALKAAELAGTSGSSVTDILLMEKLGKCIHGMKDDFIIVHLQYACTHCSQYILSGKRWNCSQCKNFHLCANCQAKEEKLPEKDRHSWRSRGKHILCAVEVTGVPMDTKDKDDTIYSEYFDTRHTFLDFCQRSNFQFNTLRRAKHSSMMVLYHLHNPTRTAFLSMCRSCHKVLEAGPSWHDEICPDYDICDACYKKEGVFHHAHKLTLAKANQQQQVVQNALDLIEHGSRCRIHDCHFPCCRKLKALLYHGSMCKKQVQGRCVKCKKMWVLLKIHSRACINPFCRIPHCKNLKESRLDLLAGCNQATRPDDVPGVVTRRRARRCNQATGPCDVPEDGTCGDVWRPVKRRNLTARPDDLLEGGT